MNDNLPVLSDEHGAAERVALEILDLAPAHRAGAARRIGNVYAAMAMTSGRPARVADHFGTRMQGLIGDAVKRLEARRAARPKLVLPAGHA